MGWFKNYYEANFKKRLKKQQLFILINGLQPFIIVLKYGYILFVAFPWTINSNEGASSASNTTNQNMTKKTSHYETFERGDHSSKIQGRIMVLVHCPSSHSHLHIAQVPF